MSLEPILNGLPEPVEMVFGIIFTLLLFGGMLFGSSLVVAIVINYLLFRYTDIEGRPENSLVWSTGLASLTYYVLVLFMAYFATALKIAILDMITLPFSFTIMVPWLFGFGSSTAAMVFVLLIQVLVTWGIIYYLCIKRIRSLASNRITKHHSL